MQPSFPAERLQIHKQNRFGYLNGYGISGVNKSVKY